MINDDTILETLKANANYELAFSNIFKIYHKKVYWNVRRILIDHSDSDDVTQNIFIKIWNGLPNFKNDSKLYTWIYRITVNESLTFLKSRKIRATFSFHDYEQELSNKLHDNNIFCGNEIERNLNLAILKLPPKQRQVFNLRYYDEMPYEEMSEVLSTSVGALKASYHHASSKVELFLKQI